MLNMACFVPHCKLIYNRYTNFNKIQIVETLNITFLHALFYVWTNKSAFIW